MAHFAQIDDNGIVQQVIVVSNNDCLDANGNESEAVGVAFCQNLLAGTGSRPPITATSACATPGSAIATTACAMRS